MLPKNTELKVYANGGNHALLGLLDSPVGAVLDVGCGAGDNALLLRVAHPESVVYGITASPDERALALRHMACCWIADLECGLPPDAQALTYDVLIFSHVLEHVRDPATLVAEAVSRLRPGGVCAIAVPNVMAWSQRAKFLRGNFEYETSGIMDNTHLRFFSYETAVPYLLAKSPCLRVTKRTVTGSVPLWLLRRHVFPKAVSARIDRVGCMWLPNLFGGQVLIKAVKQA